MKLVSTLALLALLGGTAQAQVTQPLPAPAPASPACAPTDFAKGLCDSLSNISSSSPRTLSLAPEGALPTGGVLHIDPSGQQGFEHAAAEWRSQAASPTPGGVPSIRPLGSRPAVVVPLLSF